MKSIKVVCTCIVLSSIFQIGIAQIQHEVEGKSLLMDSNEILEINSSNHNSWIDISNINGSRGYIGIFNGINDIDVGTNNSQGKTHLVTQAMPRLTVTADGKVGIGTTAPEAAMEIESSNSGLLIPRLNFFERDAIVNPQNGLLIYNTSASEFNYYDTVSATWRILETNKKEKTAMISGTAFSARQSHIKTTKGLGLGIRIVENGNYGVVANLNIPFSATITSITFYFKDNDPNSELKMELKSENMSSIGTSFSQNYDSGVSFASPSIQSHTINFSQNLFPWYGYFINVTGIWDATSTNLEFFGARVNYLEN